jgi:uncharacterized membrane protein
MVMVNNGQSGQQPKWRRRCHGTIDALLRLLDEIFSGVGTFQRQRCAVRPEFPLPSDLTYLAQKIRMPLSTLLVAHIATAATALLAGSGIMLLRKGTSLHRMNGRLWVGLMLTTALLSFGIRSSGSFSWIHLLSLWTIFTITMGIFAIRARRIEAHRRWMRGTYLGLIGAAIFTLLPQRLLGHLLWHGLGLA